MYCIYCGTPINENSESCQLCGKGVFKQKYSHNHIEQVIAKMSDGKLVAKSALLVLIAFACFLFSLAILYLVQRATSINPIFAFLEVVINIIWLYFVIRAGLIWYKRTSQTSQVPYSLVPLTGFLIKAVADLYVFTIVRYLLRYDLIILFEKRIPIYGYGNLTALFPFSKMQWFLDGRGGFIFSWEEFFAFNFETIVYGLFVFISLSFLSHAILCWYHNKINNVQSNI